MESEGGLGEDWKGGSRKHFFDKKGEKKKKDKGEKRGLCMVELGAGETKQTGKKRGNHVAEEKLAKEKGGH